MRCAELLTPGLAIQSVSKRFGQVAALEAVSLTVRPGEVHCLLGENGAGKSTLCNLIFGLLKPDQGTIVWKGRNYAPRHPADAMAQGIAMVHQHFSLVPTLSVLDNLMLGRARGWLNRRSFARRVGELALRFGLEVDPDRITGDLSVGERQRIEIVKCLMGDPSLLVLDEPTAVLPPDEVSSFLAVVRRIADSGDRGIILVTHKLAEVARVADTITVLRGGRVAASAETRTSQDLKPLVRAMVGRDIGELAGGTAASLGLDRTDARAGDAKPAQVSRTSADAFVADGLTFRDEGGTVRLDSFTVVVRMGEIVGVAGVEGNGQAELGSILAGLDRAEAGRFFVGDRELTQASPAEITAAGSGLIPEDRHATACVLEMSVAENLLLARLGEYSGRGFLNRTRMRSDAAEAIRRYDVRCAGPDAAFSSLSGGNQQKCVLARELSLNPLRFLLAAQPTRGLDVGAVEAVYDQLRRAAERGVGVLLISSELDELMAVTHRIVVLYRGRIAGELKAGCFDRQVLGAFMAGHAP